jgi:hypothetical protein
VLHTLRFKGKADPLLCPPLAKTYHVTVGGIVEPSDPRLPVLSQPFFYHGASHGPDGEWTIPAKYRVLYTKQYTAGDDPWPFHFLMQRWVTVIEVIVSYCIAKQQYAITMLDCVHIRICYEMRTPDVVLNISAVPATSNLLDHCTILTAHICVCCMYLCRL